MQSCGVGQQPVTAPPAWNAGFSRHRGPQGRGWFLATSGALARAAEPSRRMRSVSPPACGGLCRLKPAFQAVSAVFMTGGVHRRTRARVLLPVGMRHSGPKARGRRAAVAVMDQESTPSCGAASCRALRCRAARAGLKTGAPSRRRNFAGQCFAQTAFSQRRASRWGGRLGRGRRRCNRRCIRVGPHREKHSCACPPAHPAGHENGGDPWGHRWERRSSERHSGPKARGRRAAVAVMDQESNAIVRGCFVPCGALS